MAKYKLIIEDEDDYVIPVPKFEFECLLSDSTKLEMIIDEALKNKYFGREDLLRMGGRADEKKE